MMRTVMSLCLAAAMTAALGAQDKMAGMKADHAMGMTKTYSGCLERSADGAFAISHATEMKGPHAKGGGKMMAHDSMSKDAVAKGDMSKDAMAKDAMTLPLTGKDAELANHVGHEVRVTGTPAADATSSGAAFSVTSIKSIGDSCK